MCNNPSGKIDPIFRYNIEGIHDYHCPQRPQLLCILTEPILSRTKKKENYQVLFLDEHTHTNRKSFQIR